MMDEWYRDRIHKMLKEFLDDILKEDLNEEQVHLFIEKWINQHFPFQMGDYDDFLEEKEKKKKSNT